MDKINKAAVRRIVGFICLCKLGQENNVPGLLVPLRTMQRQ
jgi:hypothetical protein